MSTETNSLRETAPGDALRRVDEAVCAFDDEWQFTFVNDRAAAVLEHEPLELLGEELWEVIPEIQDSIVGDKLREAMDTQDPIRFDRYNDALERWFKIRLYPSDDGITGCFYDITDERGEQLDLQRQRRLFETVFEETEDALVVADTDRRITDFNPSAERLFGYEASEVIGKNAEILYADTTDYEKHGEERFNVNAPERGETYVVEYERADETTFDGETLGTSLKGPDGETLAFLGSIRDVSSRVAYEQEIEAHNDVLQTFHGIATDEGRDFEDQVESLLELGRDHLGLDIGTLASTEDENYTVEHALDPDGKVEQGAQHDLAETYCARVVDAGELVAMPEMGRQERPQHPAYRQRELESYIGVPVVVEGDEYGTLSFSDDMARTSFTDGDRTFVRLLAQWIGKELSRQQNRERATANRERLRQIIDMVPQLVFAKDRDGTFLLANEAVADAYGTTVEELEGATDADFANSAEEARQFRDDDRAVIESEERKVIPEEPLTTADGETRVMQTTKIPYDPVDHETEAVLGVATDITELKERDDEIELQSEAMEVAMDGIAILDDDEYVYMNETHADIFGYEPEELLGSEWRRLYDDEEIERFESAVVPSIAEHGEWRGEAVGRKADGTPVYQDIGLSLLDSGELICTNRDITEQKQREQELREVKERLDLAVEGADIGIWDWNMETDAVTFNEQWAAMLGFSLDELEPTLQTWEDRVHSEDMPHVEEQLEAHLTGETDLYDCEHRMRTKDGNWRWIRDVGKVVERRDGEATRAVGIHLDITDQKESALYLEEERDMFAQGPAVVFKWQNEDCWPVEYVSENVTETFGYTPEQLQSGNVPYTDLVHDDDLDRVANEVEAQSDATTERFSHDPYRMVTSTGEVRWVTDNTKIIRNDGEITHYLGYLIDITEQKRLEASLRDSEQSLRELTAVASDTDQSFEAKLDTLLELGTERLGIPYGFLTRIENGTQHVTRAVGTHPTLQTGNTAPKEESYCRKTLEQDGVLDISDAIAEGWSDDPAYQRYDLGCYIGETIVVDGKQYGTLCFADHESRDYSFDDAERAFVELLVQWVSYELASDAFESKLQEINDRARQLMAAPTKTDVAEITTESANSVLGMQMTGIWWYDDELGALVPERQTDEATAVVGDQPTFEPGESLAWRAFEAGEVSAYDDLRNVPERHNESSELRSEVIVPLGEHGVIIASSTEPRAFSETDLNLLEVLSATVESALTRAQREERLRETQQELQQSNEQLEQFAYAASHDLQEPLRSISSYLTLLERRYRDGLDDDAVDFIDFAVDGADRMREMIQALLAYSRVDTEGQRFEPVAVDSIFEHVTQNLETTIEEHGATVSIPATTLAVTGDDSQLIQLFQNLVDNGIKYNDGTPRIDISATAHEDTVRFEVTDNGIGIESDQTDEIFEVFKRLHTREEFDGTGIGLSVCRKIVERHDGSIGVESVPGDGSTFVVTLPRSETTDE